MQLIRLWLKEFRNLKDLDLHFTQSLPAEKDTDADDVMPIQSHALIGQNGTGKSNLMEALISIFRNIDLDQAAPFDYKLEYSINGNLVSIEARIQDQSLPIVFVNGEKKRQGFLIENQNQLLPRNIFAYYSGKNERIESLFQTHQESYKNTLKRSGDDLVRRLFYCRGGHAQLVLLACMLDEHDTTFRKILNNLGIESVISANFVLKKPYSLRKLEDDDILEGDPRFWFARGTVVEEFLSHLWSVAWAPIQDRKDVAIDFRRRPEKQDLLYLFVPNQAALDKLGTLVGTAERFFRYAEAAYIGDLLEELRITVKKKDAEGEISFKQLSEGELQLLTVLGLMRLKRQDDCLFLLDEPDTHLNPIWKLRYFDDIQEVLKQDEEETLRGQSQILITTHDPMMIGSLKKEQVHIIRKVDGETIVDQPEENPQGMGVTGLLKSELFGLSSTLDSETERRLFRRNALFALDDRTPEQEAELRKLSDELSDLGFATSDFKDPFYAMFVRKMAKHTQFQKQALTKEEQDEQDAIADDVINEILREEGEL